MVGTVFAGWFTDKVFKGRGVRTCVICMLFAALFSFGFWYLPAGASSVWATLLLMGVGFCIYGPQALVGITAANQATKEAAAMANGFTGMTYAQSFCHRRLCDRRHDAVPLRLERQRHGLPRPRLRRRAR